MEFSSFPCSSLDETVYGAILSPLPPPPPPPPAPVLGSPDSSEWTSEEDLIFENAVTDLDPSSPLFFQNVADRLPWKTLEQVKRRYQTLLMIDGDLLEFPVHEPVPAQAEDRNHVVEEEDAPPARRNQVGQRRRHRGLPWTEDEHQLFLMGLNKFGKGDWRSISRYYVVNKTPTQVASHAQKFFRRWNVCTPPDRRRPSIHDVRTVNPDPPVIGPLFVQFAHPNHRRDFDGGAVINPGSPPAAEDCAGPSFPMNPNWGW